MDANLSVISAILTLFWVSLSHLYSFLAKKINDHLGRSVVTMAQFDSDNLRIARPSEVLSNIKVMVSIQNFGLNCFLRSLLLVKGLVCTYMGIQLESGPKCRPRWLISIIFAHAKHSFANVQTFYYHVTRKHF